MKNFLKRQTGTISPLVILAVIAILGIGGYFVFGKNLATKPTASDAQNTNSQAELKTYTDTERGFSVSYPKDWIITEIQGSNPKDSKNPEEKIVEFRPAGQRYTPLFMVGKIEKSDKWNPEEFKKEMIKPGEEISQEVSDIAIGEAKGWNLHAVTKNFDSVDYFQFSYSLLSKDNQRFYEIKIWDAKDYPNKTILDEMLNSFKIL